MYAACHSAQAFREQIDWRAHGFPFCLSFVLLPYAAIIMRWPLVICGRKRVIGENVMTNKCAQNGRKPRLYALPSLDRRKNYDFIEKIPVEPVNGWAGGRVTCDTLHCEPATMRVALLQTMF